MRAGAPVSVCRGERTASVQGFVSPAAVITRITRTGGEFRDCRPTQEDDNADLSSSGWRWSMMHRSLRRAVKIPAARTSIDAWSARGIAAALHEALSANRIGVVYQPVIDLAGQAWNGVEALARWTDRERGPIPPDVFIPVAETYGLITDLSRQVSRRVAADWSRWRHIGRGGQLHVAVNLSAADLMNRATIDQVTERLVDRELPLDHLMLEITETAPLEVGAGVVEALTDLRDHGTSVALDDFGAGQSRMADLRRVPVTTLKLDRFFTHDQVGSSLADPEMAAGVQALATTFGLDTVAEGVETGAEAEALKNLGYDKAQGWHYARPISSQAVEQALTRGQNFRPDARSA